MTALLEEGDPWFAMYGTVRVQLEKQRTCCCWGDTKKFFFGAMQRSGKVVLIEGDKKFFRDAKNFFWEIQILFGGIHFRRMQKLLFGCRFYSGYKMRFWDAKCFLGGWRSFFFGGREKRRGGGGDTRRTLCFNLDLRRELRSADLSARTDRADPQSAPKLALSDHPSAGPLAFFLSKSHSLSFTVS